MINIPCLPANPLPSGYDTKKYYRKINVSLGEDHKQDWGTIRTRSGEYITFD